jgi:hypothetical protein
MASRLLAPFCQGRKYSKRTVSYQTDGITSIDCRRRDDVKVRLAKRFARKLNSVDSSGDPHSEIVDLPPLGAEALIAEGWATAVDDGADETHGLHMAAPDERAEAADRPRRRSS